MSFVVSSYSFSHSAKTVTLSGITSPTIENILLITDVTNNTVIYQFNNPLLGGTLSGSVLTLTLNTTSGFSDSDHLQIIYAADPALNSDGGALAHVTNFPLGHGTAATAIRVELSTDGTGVVGLAAGAAKIGIVTTDQTAHGTSDLVAADITKVAGAAISQGHGTAATAIRVELPTDGTGLTGAQISDGLTPANKATVAQFHNADNQNPGTTAFGLLTGGVAQTVNAAGNLDRQRSGGSDQVPMRGVVSGCASFVQEFLGTSTTSVAAAATTATLNMTNTNGFVVGGTLNFEPSFTSVIASKLESATITAVVANTSVVIAFPTGGAVFTHTQPYTVQTFLANQERDFSGEQQSAQGIGAAIAADFESNSGGPPLSSGIASGWTLDADRNVQGKNNIQLAITSTTSGNTTLVFSGNPWTSGLIIGQSLILSVTANGAAVETVIVSKNNLPVTGAGPITVALANPVVSSSSAFALFDSYGLNVATSVSAVGVEDCVPYLYDSGAADPKRPLSPWNGSTARGADVNIKAVAGTPIASVAQESGGNLDVLQLLKSLRRSVRTLETMDSAQRQRITIDNIAAGVALPAVTTVTTVTTVGTISLVPNMLGWDQHQIGIHLRNAFANTMRARITG